MLSYPAAPQFHAPAGLIIGRAEGPVVRATGIRYARAARFRPPTLEPPA
ncbi:MAG: carboxylesterase/lipase family protein, partial [Bacteroidota bacterium]|nr:carboxylesterase/lipase family protein [Bacteroidota bacterium]